jgi:hypothetical protein
MGIMYIGIVEFISDACTVNGGTKDTTNSFATGILTNAGSQN